MSHASSAAPQQVHQEEPDDDIEANGHLGPLCRPKPGSTMTGGDRLLCEPVLPGAGKVVGSSPDRTRKVLSVMLKEI